MTVGFWHEQAQREVRAAITAITGHRAANASEVNALIHARTDLYHQMARITELLVGGRPAEEVPSKAAVTLILERHGQSLTRLYLGLRAAAVVDQQYPPAPNISVGPARSLRRAADALGVMGDIIAGHLPSIHRPGTPEGNAIRAGGGVQGALADLARLTVDAVRLDGRLPAWLNRGGPLATTYRPVTEAARWTSTSRLSAVARELVATAKTEPGLRELDTARSPLHPAPAVETLDAAIAAIRAARTWLWLHPDQITGVHLQIGTQLGLAVHVLTAGGKPEMIGGWRQAAIAAADLRAVPAAGPAHSAAAELREALRWTRSLLNPSPQASSKQQSVTNTERLVSEMLLVAATLHRGLHTTIQRGNLFVRGDSVLERPAGSLVYRAAPRWRPATGEDDLVSDLSRALWQALGPNTQGDPAGVLARVLARPPRLPVGYRADAMARRRTVDRDLPPEGQDGPDLEHARDGRLSRQPAEPRSPVARREAREEGGPLVADDISID